MNTPNEHATLDELTAALNGASEAQEWARAIALGESALVLAPNNAEIREATALAYNEHGNEVSEQDSAQALRDFDRSIELNPNDAVVRYNRAFAWHKLQEYTKAICDLTDAIALDATDADSYVLRARCHRALSNHRDALADYTRALALNPAMQDADLFTERGLTLIALHRSAEAVADLTRALEIEPAPGRWDVRAACYIGAGEYERAVSDSMRAITEYPGEGSFYRTLSVAYREGGDPARAVIECNRAIGLDPRQPTNYWSRALALTALGREDEAQTDRYQAAAMEVAPDRAMDIFDAAWTHAQTTGKVAPARAVPASEGGRPHPDLHRERAAEALYHQGRFTEAISACRSILAARATVEAHGILAVSLVALGDLDAGLVEMERALVVEPSYRWLLSEMGGLLLRHGYAHEAVQAFAAAMTEPTPQRELGLGSALAAVGLRGAARPHLERAAAAGLTATAQPAGVGRVDRGAPRAIRGLIPRPALASRRPRAEITLAQRWILATGALMTELYGGLHDALGMFPVDYIGRESAASFLGRHWNIRNRAEAVKALDWLEGGGDSEEYAQLCAMVNADDPRVHEARLPNDRARADVAFVRNHQRDLGTRYLLAWDLARVVGVAGWSALAGYIEEREAWDRGLRAAQRLQVTYSSWQELGRHYLLGRVFAVGEVNAEAEQAYARLLSDGDSPWVRLTWNTLLHEGPTAGQEMVIRPREVRS
jgi:tetratricopeptide (TPR) repeat protein